MKAFEFDSGLKSRLSTKLYPASDLTSLLDLVLRHPFNHQVEVFTPSIDSEQNFPPVGSFSDGFYYHVVLPLGNLLTPTFINSYIRPGSFFCLSACGIDRGNSLLIRPDGILVMSVDRDTYQLLGLQGTKSVFKCRQANRFNITINLLDAAFAPGRSGYERTLAAFQRSPEAALLVSSAHDVDFGPAATVSRRLNSLVLASFPNILLPALSSSSELRNSVFAPFFQTFSQSTKININNSGNNNNYNSNKKSAEEEGKELEMERGEDHNLDPGSATVFQPSPSPEEEMSLSTESRSSSVNTISNESSSSISTTPALAAVKRSFHQMANNSHQSNNLLSLPNPNKITRLTSDSNTAVAFSATPTNTPTKDPQESETMPRNQHPEEKFAANTLERTKQHSAKSGNLKNQKHRVVFPQHFCRYQYTCISRILTVPKCMRNHAFDSCISIAAFICNHPVSHTRQHLTYNIPTYMHTFIHIHTTY
jgi:hypothetical protein